MSTDRKNEIENYVKTNNVDAIREMLEHGMSPKEEIHYTSVDMNGREFENTSTLFNLACFHDKLDIVKLLVEYKLDLNPKEGTLLYIPFTWNRTAIFSYMVECGASIEKSQDQISRLFLWMDECDFSEVEEAVKKLELPLKEMGGEALRSAAAKGNLPMARFLLSEGVDIDYRWPDMIYPYASTPVIEAARHNEFEMVKYLAEQGADIMLTDRHGARPYTLAVKNKNAEMVEFLKAREPKELHMEEDKKKALKSYKLPANLVEYLKNGSLKLEFPNGRLLKWVKLYSYMDTVEVKWKRRKLLSIMESMDNYSDCMLVWNPKDARLWYIDEEHETFMPLCTWDEFIGNPEKYMHNMVEGK